jgi:isocitrate dehydrogenase
MTEHNGIITYSDDGRLSVPDVPVIPFIEGDGIGPDIWQAARRVLDAAVLSSYGSDREIQWLEVLAGEKAFNQTQTWLPEETLEKESEVSTSACDRSWTFMRVFGRQSILQEFQAPCSDPIRLT